MQAAMAPAPLPDANKHEYERQGQARYIVAWREHDCSNRDIGHLRLPPKQFVQITDLLRHVLDMSHSAFMGQSDNESGLVPSLKTSLKIVDELLHQWGSQGLVHLDALTNLPAAVIIQFEKLLLPDPAMRLADIGAKLEAAQNPGGTYAAAFETTRRRLQTGLAQAIAWHADTVQRARDEYAGRMRGEVGIASFTPMQKHIAAEIGEELREGETVRVDAKDLQGGSPDAMAQAVMALAQQQAQTNALLMQLLGAGQVSPLARAIVAETPLPPTLTINPDEEAPGLAPPDEVLIEEAPASVQPPKKRNR